jgi:DNA-binding transcriptional regulator YiaG
MDKDMVLRKKNTDKNIDHNKVQANNIGKKMIDPLTGEVFRKTNKSLDKEKINKLVSMRVEANLDQKALAVKLNVPFSEIKDAEAGKEIKLKTYNAICKYVE